MQINLSGIVVAGSLWLLAAVVAWPWGHPAVAAAVLIGQIVAVIALVLADTGHTPGASAFRVRRRNQR